MRLSPAEVRERLEEITSRAWPVERLFTIWQDRRAGLTIEQIAGRDGTGPENVSIAVHRLVQAGLLGPRLSEWTPATVAYFRTLWDEAVPIPEMARRIGVTSNAIIGKSHRLIAEGVIAARPAHRLRLMFRRPPSTAGSEAAAGRWAIPAPPGSGSATP